MNARATNRRLRFWLGFAVIVAVSLGSVFLYVWQSYRITSADFEKLSSLSYEKATEEVKKHARGHNLTETYFGTEKVKCEALLDPGSGAGVAPRFLNVGKTPAQIWKGETGTWYILGKVQVLDYVSATRQWKPREVISNAKYIYKPLD